MQRGAVYKNLWPASAHENLRKQQISGVATRTPLKLAIKRIRELLFHKHSMAIAADGSHRHVKVTGYTISSIISENFKENPPSTLTTREFDGKKESPFWHTDVVNFVTHRLSYL